MYGPYGIRVCRARISPWGEGGGHMLIVYQSQLSLLFSEHVLIIVTIPGPPVYQKVAEKIGLVRFPMWSDGNQLPLPPAAQLAFADISNSSLDLWPFFPPRLAFNSLSFAPFPSQNNWELPAKVISNRFHRPVAISADEENV